MQRKHTRIINKLGLHARAATKFSSLANRFPCRIEVSYNARSIDGKSIMSLMLLAASQGSDIILETDGPEEEDAMLALIALIEDRFGEGE